MNKALFSLLFFCACTASGQVSKTVVKAQAFATVHLPGTVQVDESGNELPRPRTTVYTVYLEVKGANPEWKTAWVGGKVFNILPSTLASTTVDVGKRKANGEIVKMSAANGNQIQFLELSPGGKQVKSPQPVAQNEVLLTGSLKGKPVTYKISTVTELASPEYQ